MSAEPKPVAVGFYKISYPVNHKYQKKTWWLRIGSATLLDNNTLLGRIEAVPVNWDGSFHLFPSTAEEERDSNA